MSIKWIHQFDLFLFDFDGLLVNTEELHLAAYIKMCKNRGFDLNWDFKKFCSIAHFDAVGIRNEIYRQFPALFFEEATWEVLYAEKKKAYMELLQSGFLQLLPGVENLLRALEESGIRHCVATNSAKEQIEFIKERLPQLKSIPLWVTREQYDKSKPAPDAYLKAIELLGKSGDRMIGFEDSLKGVKALKGTQAKPLLVCSSDHPQLKEIDKKEIFHFESLSLIPTDHTFV